MPGLACFKYNTLGISISMSLLKSRLTSPSAHLSQFVCNHPSVAAAGTPCIVIPPVAIHVTGGDDAAAARTMHEPGKTNVTTFAYAGRVSLERCPGLFVHAAASARQRLRILLRKAKQKRLDIEKGVHGKDVGGVGDYSREDNGNGQRACEAEFVILGGGGILPSIKKLDESLHVRDIVAQDIQDTRNGLDSSSDSTYTRSNHHGIHLMGNIQGPTAMMDAMSENAHVVVNTCCIGETFGIVTVEAMSLGIPVIACRQVRYARSHTQCGDLLICLRSIQE